MALPFVCIIVIVVLNPTYFTPLISSPIGFLVDGLIVILYLAYALLIKKVMKVDEV